MTVDDGRVGPPRAAAATVAQVPPAAVVVAVAAGGAVGALGRHGVSLVLPAGGADAFPWATLLVNLLGSLLLGLAIRRPMPPVLAAGLRTGVLGAFTTFSAFAVETAVLAERAGGQALAYVVLSIGGGLLAARVGAGTTEKDP